MTNKVIEYYKSLFFKYRQDLVEKYGGESSFSVHIDDFSKFLEDIDKKLKVYELLQDAETNDTQKKEKETLIQMIKSVIEFKQMQDTFIIQFRNIMLQKLKEEIGIVGDEEIKTEEEKNERLKKIQEFVSLLDPTLTIKPHEVLKLFTYEEMEKKYKARIKDGIFVNENKEPLNSIKYRFILRSSGQLYLFPAKIPEIDLCCSSFCTRHSSCNFTDVIAAGELNIKDGRIWSVSNESGHYKPGLSSIRKLSDALVSLIPDSEQRKLHTCYYDSSFNHEKKL